MVNPLRKWFNNQGQRFRERRLPRSDQQSFDRKNLFIMPTRFGMSLLFCCALLFILGTNYQNNPILIFSYLLLAWFLLSLFYCFVNLSGSQVRLLNVSDCFRGDSYQLQLQLHTREPSHQWQFWYNKQLLNTTQVVNDGDNITVSLTAQKRGWFYPPELMIRTIFPSGLFQCWSYLRFESKHWVYPKPQHGDWQWQNDSVGQQASERETIAQHKTTEGEELNFEGIKPHQVGESLARVSWKHQAKMPTDDLLSKDFASLQQQAFTLSLESVFNSKLEHKLEVLTHAILTLEQSQHKYGLRLSGYGHKNIDIPPATGKQHMQNCLQQLALFNQQLVEGN